VREVRERLSSPCRRLAAILSHSNAFGCLANAAHTGCARQAGSEHTLALEYREDVEPTTKYLQNDVKTLSFTCSRKVFIQRIKQIKVNILGLLFLEVAVVSTRTKRAPMQGFVRQSNPSWVCRCNCGNAPCAIQ